MSHKLITDWPSEPLKYDEEIPLAGGARGWIQWKGTNVCMDIHCPCGAHSHIDDDFLYFFRCHRCGVTYSVGQTVRLYPIDPEYVEKIAGDRAKTDEGCDADE